MAAANVVVVPVKSGDTAETLAARYTIGGAAYGPALVQVNGWFDREGNVLASDETLSDYFGNETASIPREWLRAGAQVASTTQFGLNQPVAGVPAWVWLGLAVIAATL